MSRYIRQYVSTCDLCLRKKPLRQALVGKLHPLWIPDLQWDTLSIDFIMELPLSSRHNAAMTVVDSVSKWAHFILMHTTVTVEGAARLFLHQVWKLHSLPKCIISDHGDGDQREFDHKTKTITNENIKDLQDVSQLCTKQVGTGEMIKYKRELKNRGNRGMKLK